MIALPRLPGGNQTETMEPFEIYEANDINETGWVVGEGGSDEWHAILWTLKR